MLHELILALNGHIGGLFSFDESSKLVKVSRSFSFTFRLRLSFTFSLTLTFKCCFFIFKFENVKHKVLNYILNLCSTLNKNTKFKI